MLIKNSIVIACYALRPVKFFLTENSIKAVQSKQVCMLQEAQNIQDLFATRGKEAATSRINTPRYKLTPAAPRITHHKCYRGIFRKRYL